MRALKKPRVADLVSSVSAIQAELQEWRAELPLDGPNARVFADKLRKLAAWVSPEEVHQPKPEGAAAGA